MGRKQQKTGVRFVCTLKYDLLSAVLIALKLLKREALKCILYTNIFLLSSQQETKESSLRRVSFIIAILFAFVAQTIHLICFKEFFFPISNLAKLISRLLIAALTYPVYRQ